MLLLPVAGHAQGTHWDGAEQIQGHDRGTPEPAAGLHGEEQDEFGTIVVTGTRSVIGDIPPENVLDHRDVLATGATDIDELLEAIEPQIGSAASRGGGRPIMLVNGHRISSFRELRDIPTEAIAQVEILPEEVALRYGYRADQKVVNFVLRPRFRSTVARLEGTLATEGGYGGAEADLTRLILEENSRTTLDLDIELNDALSEAERDILLQDPDGPDPRKARTLIASRRQYQATATHNRMIGTVAATGNLELSHVEGRSLIGLGETLLEPLARNVETSSAHAGAVLNGNFGEWRWSVTGNGNAARTITRTERDLTQAGDQAETIIVSGDIDVMANGSPLRLPAGEAGATVRAAARSLHLNSERRRDGLETSRSLSRSIGLAAANLDLPVSRRNSGFAAFGNLTANANGNIEQLSDFGTLTTIGAGANWSPVRRLTLIASWTREEGAPSVQQLGDPLLETPDTRIFDFVTGETVLVTAITGGNPALDADRRNLIKYSAYWKPLTKNDLTVRGQFLSSRTEDPISSFPGPTATLEAAFPERFVRNARGELVSVDLRPVNFESARRDTLRIGFDFSKLLRSELRRGDGGKLQFSLTDTVTLVDRVTIRDGLKLDFLRGDAVGQAGGRPRHLVEARAGWFKNGLGARLSANWRSGTRVETAQGDELRFSLLATVNLRLWANLGQRSALVAKQPWLRGTSVRLQINNFFDSKPSVRNSIGEVPFGYQPDLLDPLGRTITISVRKLFLPTRRIADDAGESGGDET